MEYKTVLAIRMLDRANRDNLPADHDVRLTADKFEEAACGFYSSPQTCSPNGFLGAWARARRAWLDYSGEDLI